MEKNLQRLTEMSKEIQSLEHSLKIKRSKRNKLALHLADSGRYTLREVARHAGFENPYLVALRKKMKS